MTKELILSVCPGPGKTYHWHVGVLPSSCLNDKVSMLLISSQAQCIVELIKEVESVLPQVDVTAERPCSN